MPPLPATVSESHIWRTTLAPQVDDHHSEPRERLRTSFLQFRDRAGLLAGEIRGFLPQLTLHDFTHIDSLWESASIVAGDDLALTPSEAFVLGGAFLLHDLGMAVPSLEKGLAGIRDDVRWHDLVTYYYRAIFERDPRPEEMEAPDQQVRDSALLRFLQQTHAASAERLAFQRFNPPGGETALHLIDSPELRHGFGRLIGRVAHSHWWSLTDLDREFPRTIGAPPWCPRNWTVDPLKIACLLRCADAAQIDGRRAPILLRAISSISEDSNDHWIFQGKLNKPYVEDDALVFTSGQTFPMSEAPAWWLCLEMLRIVDRELGSVDALLADKGSARFAARRVAGVEAPERLVPYIQTDGWLPINATIHVTDLPRVIMSVGGEELYGKRPEVALRELIQNAADAIQARRTYERRETTYGLVKVRLAKNDDSHWLEVEDNGIGMSRLILTTFLLDFGRSFWGSPEMQQEFPGLLSSGLRPIGRYGIGFFSVFMIADSVQVITRRSDAAAADTLVLEFSRGLRGRPILRPATDDERLFDGGTQVRLRLSTNPTSPEGLLHIPHEEKPRSLRDACIRLCPTLEVDLIIEEQGEEQKVITGGDWRTLDAERFLERMPTLHSERGSTDEVASLRKRAASNLQFLEGNDGEIVGRALITAGYADYSLQADLAGVVTVGGLRACSLSGIAGVLVGTPMRASRDAAKPLVGNDELKRWAEAQARLVPNLWKEPNRQAACAQYIRLCSGDTGDLPICRNGEHWCSAAAIRSRKDLPDQIVIVPSFTLESAVRNLEDYRIDDNVFVVEEIGIPGLLQCMVRWPDDRDTSFMWQASGIDATLVGAVAEAAAVAWGCNPADIEVVSEFREEETITVGSHGDRILKVPAYQFSRPANRPG